MPIISFAEWLPVPAHSGPMLAHNGLIEHVQVGNGSCYSEFSNVKNEASSTLWVAKSGRLEQYVDSDLAAWAQAAGNLTWTSVETEGTPDEALTDDQINTLARVYVWGHLTYAWPFQTTDDVNGRGFGWHGMGGKAWGGHPLCPGEIRKAQRAQILNLAQQKLNGSIPITDTGDDDSVEMFTITYLDGTKTEGNAAGGIKNARTPYYGTMDSVPPEGKQDVKELYGLIPVDINDKYAGYIFMAVGFKGEIHEFKFDKAWAQTHSV